MPTLDHLENFFDKDLKVRFEKAAEVTTALQRPATAAGYTLPGIKLSEGATLQVLGRPLNFSAALETSLKILEKNAKRSLFPQDAPRPAPGGQPWALFEITTGFQSTTALALPMGQMVVAPSAAGGGTFFYRHLLPAKKNAKRRPTLSRVVKASRLPHQLELHKMAAGEMHHWNRTFYFDFGLKARYGQVFDIDEVMRPFDDFSIELKTHIEATLSASLGFGMYDSMDLRVGREGHGKKWFRLHLERQRKKDMSLGLRLALQADYDFGGNSLVKVLDQALETSPAQQILQALADVRKASLSAAGKPWEDIKNALTQNTQRTLRKFFDGAVDLDQWVEDTPELGRLMDFAGELVDAYDSVEPTISSWWNDLLEEAHLGQDSNLRSRLEDIINFDLEAPLTDPLTDPFANLPIDLIEALTGRVLDPLLDTLERRGVIQRAQKLASEATDFLNRLAAMPDDFIGRFHTFAERTGIAQAVATLRQFDTAAELKGALNEQANQWLQSVAERLVGKAWEQIAEDDLEKIRNFAKELDELLHTLQGLPDPLRSALRRLKGEFHLNLSYHFQRVTSTSSLIDIVFDPNDRSLRRLMEAMLEQRDAQRLLARLAKLDDDSEPSYEILESVFTWRRTTTGTFSLLAKFLNPGFDRKFINQRTTALTTQIQDGARKAIYIGGFERTLLHDSYSFQAGTWLEASAEGQGTDLDAPFDRLDFSLELGIARTDHAMTQPVLAAYHKLLWTLGFLKNGPDIRPLFDHRINHQARFSLRLRFANDAVATLSQDLTEKGCQAIFVAAAQRWFRDDFTADRVIGHLGLEGTQQPVRKGMMLACEIARPKILGFSAGPEFKNWMLGHWFSCQTDDSLFKVKGNELYKPLSRVLWHRDAGFRQFTRLREHLQATDAQKPEMLLQLMHQAAKTFHRSCAGGWDNPMFNFWLLLALIDYQTKAGRLTGVRGLAQLSTRASKVDDWEQTTQWHLAEDSFDTWPPMLSA
jgi:hypothetical protein